MKTVFFFFFLLSVSECFMFVAIGMTTMDLGASKKESARGMTKKTFFFPLLPFPLVADQEIYYRKEKGINFSIHRINSDLDQCVCVCCDVKRGELGLLKEWVIIHSQGIITQLNRGNDTFHFDIIMGNMKGLEMNFYSHLIAQCAVREGNLIF